MSSIFANILVFDRLIDSAENKSTTSPNSRKLIGSSHSVEAHCSAPRADIKPRRHVYQYMRTDYQLFMN